MDKQNMAYSFNGIVSNNIKDKNFNIFNIMSEPQKHYSNWKKSDTKDYIL